MLVGSTFAWFTDSVTSGNNKIVAGNLDVELEYRNQEGAWNPVTEATKLFQEDALWEPGHTEVVYLRVKNAGTLALKYQLAVTVAHETTFTNAFGKTDCRLSDYLVFGKVESDTEIAKYATREEAWAAAGDTLGLSDYTKEAELYPAETEGKPSEQYVALVVYMPTSVGNEANYRGDVIPSVDLGMNLVATQTPYEEDGFGDDQYDKDAKQLFAGYKLQEDFAKAEPGDTILFTEDVTLDTTLKVNKSITIDGGGHTIRYTGSGYAFHNDSTESVNITVKNCIFEKPANNWANTVVTGITYENCTFNGGNVYVTPTKANDTVTIKNCTFNDAMLTLDFMNTADSTIEGPLNAVLEGNTFNINTAYDESKMHEGVGIALFIREDSGFFSGQESKVQITMNNNTFNNKTGKDTYCAYQIIQTWTGSLTQDSVVPSLDEGNNIFDEGGVYSWANYSPWAAWHASLQQYD